MGFFCAANSSALSEGKPQACPSFDALYHEAGCENGAADCMLNVTVASQSGVALSQSMLPLGLPSKLRLPSTSVKLSVKPAAAGSESVTVGLTSNSTAIYVWLSTAEQGRFSNNAIVLLPGVERQVKFMSFVSEGVSSDALSASLRVEHLGMYLLPRNAIADN